MTSRINDQVGNVEDLYAAAAKVQRGVDQDVRRTLLEHWDILVRSAQPLLGGEASSVLGRPFDEQYYRSEVVAFRNVREVTLGNHETPSW